MKCYFNSIVRMKDKNELCMHNQSTMSGIERKFSFVILLNSFFLFSHSPTMYLCVADNQLQVSEQSAKIMIWLQRCQGSIKEKKNFDWHGSICTGKNYLSIKYKKAVLMYCKFRYAVHVFKGVTSHQQHKIKYVGRSK